MTAPTADPTVNNNQPFIEEITPVAVENEPTQNPGIREKVGQFCGRTVTAGKNALNSPWAHRAKALAAIALAALFLIAAVGAGGWAIYGASFGVVSADLFLKGKIATLGPCALDLGLALVKGLVAAGSYKAMKAWANTAVKERREANTQTYKPVPEQELPATS